MEIKFENWKNGKQAVIRNSKGQLISRRKLKGSGIRTKAKAIKIFKKNGTLAKDTVTISRRKTTVSDTKGKKVQIKTDKGTVTVKDTLENATLIGKNTALIKSKEPIKNQKHYQFIVKATWGEDNIKTIGYSNLKSKGGTVQQAFDRAYGSAMEKLGINYEWTIHKDSDNKGVLRSPNGKQAITFTYTVEVGTYVQTAKNP